MPQTLRMPPGRRSASAGVPFFREVWNDLPVRGFICENPRRMETTKSVIRRPGARTKRLEKVVKGFSNHRRIEILELLAAHPGWCLGQIAGKLQIETRTASEHLRRLSIAGLVQKHYSGREVRHTLTERAGCILKFLDELL